MAFIHSVSSIAAKHSFSLPEVLNAAGIWLADKPSEMELFKRFHNASHTERRHYVLPLEKVLTLGGQNERAKLFAEKGAPLVCEVIDQALKASNLRPDQIETVIFTSCTCPLIPSLDAAVLQNMGFSPLVRRIPIYQHGCAGGAVGLGIANKCCAIGENVLLVSLELCSLLFRMRESSAVHLLGAALFSDGAAATIVSAESGPMKILATQSYLIPESAGLMGYEIREDGAHLLLDRDLPSRLQSVLPEVVSAFLEKSGIPMVDWWLIHPGGVKILDGICSLLDLDRRQCSWSYDILSELGNMSSATVQFVLQKCLGSGLVSKGDKLCMVGIGPGLTIELLAFEHT